MTALDYLSQGGKGGMSYNRHLRAGTNMSSHGLMG